MKLFLRAQGLEKSYTLDAGLFAGSTQKVRAVRGVDLDLGRGETYGLVGESGSGKSSLARLLVQLEPHDSGTIESFSVQGNSEGLVSHWDRHRLKDYRSHVRYVFQDPSSSLDPRMKVGQILTIGARYQRNFQGRKELSRRGFEVLAQVGLQKSDWERRPGEFSGGQRQRIALARALLSKPDALICDEVVSALDVSVQGQILNLLLELKQQLGLTLLFISHDLKVVGYLADRIGVLYKGRVVEEAPAIELLNHASHPYTQILYNPQKFPQPVLNQPLASDKLNADSGCAFSVRCPLASQVCLSAMPELRELIPGHRVACHHPEQL